jgi:hypothetical protein
MGTSTVSGPFRSQNGFEQLVNGEWVPVSGGGSPLSLTTTGTSGPATLVGSNLNIPNYSTGGGGGGDVAAEVHINTSNVYAENGIYSPPSPGTIITLPEIPLGKCVRLWFDFTFGSGFAFPTWAIKLPTIPGTIFSSWYGSLMASNMYDGNLYPLNTTSGGPNDTIYLYSDNYGHIDVYFQSIFPYGASDIALFLANSNIFEITEPPWSPASYPYSTPA